jgi:sodium-coupled neutral amino acid transporter 11
MAYQLLSYLLLFLAMQEYQLANLDDDTDRDRPSSTLLHDNSTGSTIWDAAFNFTNSIVGAGIVGLPYALTEAGFIAGIVLLISMTWLVDYTVRLLVLDAKLSSQTSYQGLVKHCFGKTGFIAISFFQFIFAYGAMCACIINLILDTVILGDVIPKVFRHILSPTSIFYGILTSRSSIILLCTILVSLPLSLKRDISSLAQTSALSLIMILYIVLVVVFVSFSLPKEVLNDEFSITFVGSGIFRSIGVISFAFVCHHNTFMIYGSLRVPTMDRFATVTHLSTGASLVLCLLMASGGYLAFGSNTRANILVNLPEDGWSNSARFLFGVNMFLTFPLECFVCREVIFNYIWHDNLSLISEDMSVRASNEQSRVVTLALVFSSMIIALSTCDLGFLLELTGGFAATMLAFILPTLCYLKLTNKRDWDFDLKICYASIAFGILVMVLSTIFSIANFLNKNQQAIC